MAKRVLEFGWSSVVHLGNNLKNTHKLKNAKNTKLLWFVPCSGMVFTEYFS
jgi:hypothetical protein